MQTCMFTLNDIKTSGEKAAVATPVGGAICGEKCN